MSLKFPRSQWWYNTLDFNRRCDFYITLENYVFNEKMLIFAKYSWLNHDEASFITNLGQLAKIKKF